MIFTSESLHSDKDTTQTWQKMQEYILRTRRIPQIMRTVAQSIIKNENKFHDVCIESKKYQNFGS